MSSTLRIGGHAVPAAPSISGKVEVRQSPGRGRGLFATAPIDAGELVVVWGGPSYTDRRGAERARAQGLGTMQWDEDLFSCEGVEDHPAFGINHSCDPNVWMHDAFRLAARRDIPPDEELVMDYAMLGGKPECQPEWRCRCGAANCRGVIRGQDWRMKNLQERYAGHFIPFVNQRIAREAAQSD